MSERLLPVVLVFGLSGVGKSTFGRSAEAELNFLHIEQDESSRSGPDLWIYVIESWKYFLANKDPHKLVNEIRQLIRKHNKTGAMLTFDSVQAPSIKEIEGLYGAGVVSVILHGNDEDCIKSFIETAESKGAEPSKKRWLRFNKHTSMKFKRPEYAPYRLLAFEGHDRKDTVYLLRLLQERIKDSGRSPGI